MLNHAGDRVVVASRDFLGLLERIAARLEHVEAIVVSGAGEGLPGRIGGKPVYAYEDLVAGRGGYEWPWLHEDTVALMSYTSGTTGMPKGVYHTHRQIVLHTLSLGLHLAAIAPEGYRLTRDSTVLHIVPMFHAYSWGLPYLATLLGVGQVYPGRFRPREALELIEKYGVTHSAGVPTVLKMLLDEAEAQGSKALEGLVWMSGGSALPRGLAERAQRMGVKIIGSYGMTEAAPVLTVAALPYGVEPESETGFEQLTQRAGKPLPLAVLEVVDETGEGVGEVRARTPWLAREYYRDQEKTARAWREDWFHTGDIGFFDEHGSLVLVDRAKDVIKSGGEWISSLRLESLLTTHPCVAEAAVVGAYHPKWQERPVALVVPSTCRPDPAELRRHLERFVEQGVIPKWWLPDRILLVEELPRTSVGKIDKKRLREMYRWVLTEKKEAGGGGGGG